MTLSRGRILYLLLVVALLAALATLIVLTVRWRDTTAGPRFAEAPTARAAEAASDFFDLDHRTLDADVDRFLALTTPDFASQYRRESADLRTAVEKRRLTMTPQVPQDATALEYLGTDVAQVLVGVDVTTTAAGGGSQDTRYRVRVRLERSGDQWRVSSLEQVG
ncbi:hypothetical protein GCM10022215_15650 [Nocardioides fonticola]|uniref:Mce-associated membrane protein n=1 Tax=Nocardioides fonticola TaxID=450363 RepID=A0ABP7XHS4_9ACTN